MDDAKAVITAKVNTVYGYADQTLTKDALEWVTGSRFISTWGEFIGTGILWIEQVEELILEMETEFPGLTIDRDTLVQAANQLIKEKDGMLDAKALINQRRTESDAEWEAFKQSEDGVSFLGDLDKLMFGN